MSTDSLPNAGIELQRIHKVITRALAVSLQHSQGSDLAQGHQQGFEAYVRALTIVIHSHHTGEDEVSFPFWRTRLSAGPFDVLSEQHHQIIVFLKQIEHWLGTSPMAWQSAAQNELHAALTSLQTLWHTHIALEEVTIGPENSRQYLTSAENEQLIRDLAEHGQAHARPSELVMPFVIYNLSGADRAEYVKLLPSVMSQQLVPFAWKPAWEPMMPFLLEV
jgi:hemerythrin-like domain-containing protein